MDEECFTLDDSKDIVKLEIANRIFDDLIYEIL